MNVKPCWKCELSNRHLIRSISPEGNLINLFQIKCDNCRYISSIGQTEAKAIESWNAIWDKEHPPPAPEGEVKYDYEVRIEEANKFMLRLYWTPLEHYNCYPEYRDAGIGWGTKTWTSVFSAGKPPQHPCVEMPAPPSNECMRQYRIRMERKETDL